MGLDRYLRLLDEYDAALSVAQDAGRPGRLASLLPKMDALWPGLSPREQKAALARAGDNYQRRIGGGQHG